MQAADSSRQKGSRSLDREPFLFGPVLRSRLRPWLWYTLLLALGSITVFGSVAADPGSRVVAENDDSSLFIWWLGHAAEVLARGLGFGEGFGAGPDGGGSVPVDGLLYTEAMNALSGGVNGAWNTSLAAPAILLAPVTWLAGPIISYNLLVLTTPVLVSLATALLFTRFLRRIPAFIAAAGVGFSSYVIAQLAGHPNLAFAVTPPLTAMAILWFLGLVTGSAAGGRRHSRFLRSRRFWAVSAAFGLLLGFQFYVSTEVLAGTFLAALCFLTVLAVVAGRAIGAQGWARLALGGAVASVLALLCALPLLLTMTGPNSPSGAIRPHGVWNTDLLDPIIPAAPTWLGTGESPLPRSMAIDPAELGAYVGIPALLAAVLILIGLGRSLRYARALRIASATGVLVFVLALGSPILVGGDVLIESGPFTLIESVPVLNNLLPMRLVVHSTIALFAVLGIGLEWSLDHLDTRRGKGLLGLLVAAGVSVLPGVQDSREVHVPEFYTESITEVIPAGSVVKTFPRPLAWAEPHADEAMVWQAVSDFRYRETGGYFIGSSPDSPVIYAAPEDSLDRLLHDSVYSGAPLPDPTSAEVGEAIEDLRAAGVDSIVLAPEAPLVPGGGQAYTEFLDAAFGAPDFAAEGVRVYQLGR